MKYKYRKRVRLVGLVCIVVVMVILVFQAIFKEKKDKDTITIEEICSTLQFYELHEEEWLEVFSDKVSNPVTYRDLDRIVSVLGIKSYVNLPEHGTKEVSREAYFSVYDQMLGLLDPEGLVKKQSIKVKKTLEVTSEKGVICSESFIFRVSHGFSRYVPGKSYVIYSMGMEILGVRGEGLPQAEGNPDFQNANIRVLLTSGGTKEWSPKDVSIQLNGKFGLYYKETLVKELQDITVSLQEYMKPEELSILASQSSYLVFAPLEEGARFIVHYNETTTNPYRGMLYVYPKEATCFFVNELLLEEYLYGVVPSEMPASYEMEALKAQAVCARSYAYRHLSGSGRLEYYAHVDDTTSYQVYNKSEEKATTNQAVEETKGIYLTYNGNIASTYYFSTSIGNTAGASFWGLDATEYGYLKSASRQGEKDLSTEESFRNYIKEVPTDDFESQCRYYRWNGTFSIDEDKILGAILKRAEVSSDAVRILDGDGNPIYPPTNGITSVSQIENIIKNLGRLQNLSVMNRDSCGGIRICGLIYEKGTVCLNGEYTIRYCLGACIPSITLLSGETIQPQMLPSAFFYIDSVQDEICRIYGGGYGHGLGMSQNGANGMAKCGYTYDEILLFYYNGVQCTR